MRHQEIWGNALRAAVAALLAGIVLAACGISLMPTKDAWYSQHYFIMQDFEQRAYRSLSEAGKKEFQDLFWAARDPASKEIFERRLSYIINAFKRENSRQPWNTDRARIYLLNGPPALIDIDQNTEWGIQLGQPAMGSIDRSNEDVRADRAEVWTYSFNRQYIKYVFLFIAPNEWRMSPTIAGSKFLSEMEDYNRALTFGIREPEAYKLQLQGLEKKK